MTTKGTAAEKQIRLLIVDDHAILTDTLEAAFAAHPMIRIVGTARTCEIARALALESEFDVALVDLQLPDGDGVDLCRFLRTLPASPRILILTGVGDAGELPRALSAGACGYLLKDTGLADVASAIVRAANGDVVVPESVVGKLRGTAATAHAGAVRLTPRESDVLSLLAAGADVRSLSKALAITSNTARQYIKSVLVKLDAHSQLEAVMTAIRLGLIVPQQPRMDRQN